MDVLKNQKKALVLLITVLFTASILTFGNYAGAAPGDWTEVADFDQLKTAVESAAITHIRLTGNIEFPLKTATINTAKTELVIDGDGYTLTDSNSSSLSYSLRYNKKGNLKNITIQNMNIIGINYYGMITIDDSTTYSDVTVTFDNITYTGPQLSWGRKSNYVIRDSDITIASSSKCPANEVLECLRVTLEGNVNIVKDAPKSNEELFWITGANGGVTVAAGANVNVSNNQVTAKTTSSGFVYYSCPSLHLRFEDGSAFNYVGNNLFQQCSAVDDLYVGKSALVNITLNGDLHCSYGVFQVRGNMTVEEDSVLKLYALGNTEPQPLLQLKGTGRVVFDNPREVFIYNSSTHKSNTGLAMGPWGCDVTINMNNIKSLEYWKMNTSPYTALPAPTYDWRNSDGSAFSLDMSISGSKVTKFLSLGYTGSLPLNATTAAMKDINVIRINGGGGSGGNEKMMYINVTCIEKDTNVVLDQYVLTVPYGSADGTEAPIIANYVLVGATVTAYNDATQSVDCMFYYKQLI